ncbi:MAG: FG-GAP-like repeat-containing protein, partial [Planctomycetota bacterium]|nr:FG-GAP-like repeat-containing protein [Planctomycetota bacterium]
MNGDGKIDVVTANSTSNDVSVLLNSTVLPTAAFEVSAKSDFTTETSPFSVSAGDLNGDGKPDLAVADWGAGKISVLLNTSTPGATTPTFANKVDFTAGALPRSIAIGDLNGDGRPDLAAVNLISYSVSVFLNTMTPGASVAAFSAKTDFATGTKPVSIAIGDMNGDGKADLAIANGFESSASVLMNTTAGGATTPSFAPRSTVSISGAVRSIAIGDLNGDGKPDLALANYSSTSVTVLLNTTTPGATSATFAPKSEFQTGSLPISAAISDLNGDGKLDLAVANQGSSTVSVFLNNAVVGATVASFAGKTDFATGTKPWGIAVGDLNGDGKPDLAVPTETNNTVSILINNTSLGGASAFLGKIDRATGNFPTAVAMADFNLDGRRDLAVSNLSSSSVSVLLNSPVVTLDGTGVGTITNDDHVPVFTSSATASFAENGTGTVLTVTATDADLPAQTITYSLSGGADRALFTLTNGGLLTFKNSPNFEAPGDAGTDNVYNIQVTANDGAGNTTTQNVAITVTPVNDNTPFFTSNAAVNVAENSTAVATMTATDADLPAQTITYSLSGGVDSALFSITAGGVLTFKLSPDLEAPGDVGANNVYNVQVMASDGNGGTTRMDLAVTVTPVNDNDPVFTSGATAAVNENHASSDGYLSYQLSASDADLPAQSVTFAISGGADRDRFVIRAGNRLDFVAKPNFESPTDANGDNLYEVQVGVTDGQGRSAYKDMFVTVHDDYELSVVAPLPYFSTTASFELTWSAFAAYGSLNSDIASYKVYVHEVGAVEDRLIADTSDTSMIFTGEDGHHYTFYCTSTDLGGNVEPVGEFNTETTID